MSHTHGVGHISHMQLTMSYTCRRLHHTHAVDHHHTLCSRPHHTLVICICVCVDETPASGGGSERGFHFSFPSPSQTEGTGSLQIYMWMLNHKSKGEYILQLYQSRVHTPLSIVIMIAIALQSLYVCKLQKVSGRPALTKTCNHTTQLFCMFACI